MLDDVVQLWPSPKQKSRLAQTIARDMALTTASIPAFASVDIQEFRPGHWMDWVYRPEIVPELDRLYKKPGHDSF
jgi:phenylpyruvate tautomerase PptA (4-oxalocrotonate tautomerase family)